MRERKEHALPAQHKSVSRFHKPIDRLAEEPSSSENAYQSEDQASVIYPEIESRDNSPLSMFSTDDSASRGSSPGLSAGDHEFDGVTISSMVSEAESHPTFTPQSQSFASSQFIFPDPLPSSAVEHTASEIVEACPATGESSEWSTTDDEIGTELCGSPRRSIVRNHPATQEEPGSRISNKILNFLPMLEQQRAIQARSTGYDHEAREGLPAVIGRLEAFENDLAALHTQLTDIQDAIGSNEGSKQESQNQEADGRLAYEELQSQTSTQAQQIADFQHQVQRFSRDLTDLRKAAAKDIHSLNDTVRKLQENVNSMLRSFEGMGLELLELKTSHLRFTRGRRMIIVLSTGRITRQAAGGNIVLSVGCRIPKGFV